MAFDSLEIGLGASNEIPRVRLILDDIMQNETAVNFELLWDDQANVTVYSRAREGCARLLTITWSIPVE